LQTEASRAPEAIASFDLALERVRAAGASAFVASTLVNVAVARISCGQLERAHADLDASLELCRAGVVLPATEGAAWGTLALLLHLDGNLDAAAARYRDAIERAREVGYVRFQGVYRGYLGVLRAERGDGAAARQELSAAAALLREAGDRIYAAVFDSYAALSLAAERGDAASHAACVAAIGTLERVGGAGIEDIARIQRAHALAIEAAGAARAGAELEAASRRGEALAALRAIVHADAGRTPRSGTGDVRLAARLAQGALDRAVAQRDATPAGSGAASAVAQPEHAPQLVVATSGRWFRLPSGEQVDCARHRTLRRVLTCLARSATSRRGAVVTTGELLASVWPEERPSDAARNRLKTLISKLRRMGLRELVRTDPDGYLLDGQVQVGLADDGTELPPWGR
jgi:tetratricopeptide (TPR) repeat protein